VRCPNRKCRAQTPKAIFGVDKKGKGRWGCGRCIGLLIRGKRERVRTNRKIWPAYEVYGQERTIEMNHRWIENVQRKAERMRRTAFVPHSMRG
jgi:hypothetical protein